MAKKKKQDDFNSKLKEGEATSLIDVVDDTCRESAEKNSVIRRIWEASKLASFYFASAAAKGTAGSNVVIAIFNLIGAKLIKISDEGDLFGESSKFEGLEYLVGQTFEVKTGSNLDPKIVNSKKHGLIQKVKAWWNQLRPNQSKWSWLFFALVCPNRGFMIYQMSREEFDFLKENNKEILKPGHKGTDELLQLTLIHNSKTVNQMEMLEPYLIYSGPGTKEDLELKATEIFQRVVLFGKRNQKPKISIAA